MNRCRPLLIMFVLSVQISFVNAQNFGGNPSGINWKQINTEKVRVIFPHGADSQAYRIAGLMKLLGDTTAKSIGGDQKKWNIVLQQQTTVSNAYVRLAPVMSELYMTAPQDNFSTGSIRWDDNLLIHENRHMQQFSNFNKGFTRVFSFFLGQEGQLLANGMTVPDYFFEGDAVWQETLVSEQGRGRMPSFYNGFKSLWHDNKNYSWMKLRNGSFKDLVPDHYALGYLVTAYGYEKYGQDFWQKVTHDAVRFKGVFYSFNRAIERYSGKGYRQFREDALRYFKEKGLPAESDTKTAPDYITKQQKDNVIDYKFPQFINDDSILISKSSFKDVDAFYILSGGKESRIRVRDIAVDDYYSYRNGKIVFAVFDSDPRWTNRDYSIIKMLDIYSGEQKQVTFRSKYFSPDINMDGTEILAVEVDPGNTHALTRIDVQSGRQVLKIPNKHNFFFTQTRYINASQAVSAVRDPEGKMALVLVDLTTGESENLTPFSYQLLGYPFVKNDTVYFNAMHGTADKIFAVTISGKKIFQITDNSNAVYYPAVNTKGEMLVSAFTSGGYRLAKTDLNKSTWTVFSQDKFMIAGDQFFNTGNSPGSGDGLLNSFNKDWRDNSSIPGLDKPAVSRYRKSFRLFNFHSRRPVADDPEYGYTFYSDNILSSFRNNVTYTYNRTDKSHTIGFNAAYAGWFPVLGMGVEESFNRTVDTAFGKSVNFNAATVKAGVSIPLRFINGRTRKFLNFGGGYNMEQYYYRGVGKNVFNNKSINYLNAFLNFSNASRQARQHINPRWAQTLSVHYRDAFNFRDSYKFVAHGSLFFPGLSKNHSLVINAAFQKRDTLPDLFSKVFSYARGYEALSTRRMYKLGFNYHFPVVYPDWGFANLVFFQRIRANGFFDYTNAKARVNNILTEIVNRSAGMEMYFDSKIWNAFPISFGVRYARLLDTDLLNPLVKNRWEIIIPIGIIPD